MATITLELPPELYQRIHQEADRLGTSPESLARQWIAEKSGEFRASATGERDRAREALRAAGLLTELGPELRKLARPGISLDKVRASFSRAGGKPLSEIISEQRAGSVLRDDDIVSPPAEQWDAES